MADPSPRLELRDALALDGSNLITHPRTVKSKSRFTRRPFLRMFAAVYFVFRFAIITPDQAPVCLENKREVNSWARLRSKFWLKTCST